MKLRVEDEWSDVVAAIDTGELEQPLELLLEQLTGAYELEQALELLVDVGTEHPLALRYRRRLATALY